MPDFVVTGKKGNGKTLSMVDLIYRHVNEGRKIATNLDLNLDKLFKKDNRSARIIRVPDLPKSPDLHLLGYGNDSLNEDMNGALILDELAISMNSRTYQDKDRQDVINWLVQARKFGWDVYYLVQDISMLDKQVREGLAEHVVYCRRLDRVHIPIIGTLFKLVTGCRLKPPRLHVATVKYGTGPNAPLADRWQYRGDRYFKAYNTRQKFRADYPHGSFSYLPPYFITYRSLSKRTGAFYMRLTKVYMKRFSKVAAFAFGAFLSLCIIGGFVAYQIEPEVVVSVAPVLDVTDEEKQLFKNAKIVSFSVLPGRQPIFYLKTDNSTISSRELLARGFSLSMQSKNAITFTKGAYRETIYSF